jgi:hypothetical protein
MSNVDIEIYISQLITFFENNPNELMDLIGEGQKKEFFDKVRIYCQKNYDEGKEITLTKEQVVQIILELKFDEVEKPKKITPDVVIEIDRLFQKTKFGNFGLN